MRMTDMGITRRLLLLCLLWSLQSIQAFTPSKAQVSFPPARSGFLLLASESPSTDYDDTEVQEMRELILSLSLEPTDHDRRTRVKEVFDEALARPNGMPKRFTDLFDAVLIKVGDQVQMEAKKKFFDESAASAGEEGQEEIVEVENKDVETGNVGSPKEKSADELQLWALVDMMVQSKTIVKKENGELGSKGNFQ